MENLREMQMHTSYLVLTSMLVVALFVTTTNAQNKRDMAVREDKQELANDDSWIYDDLDSAVDVAKSTNRPLMIVFR